MRSFVIGAAMAIAAVGPVMAQGAPGPSGGQQPSTILLVPAPGNGGPQPGMGSGQAPASTEDGDQGQAQVGQGQVAHGQPQDQGSRESMADRMHRMMMWRAAHEGGASFRLRRGQAEIDIRCPAAEPVAACVAAAGTLLDKVASMRNPGATEPGSADGQGGSGQPGSGQPGSGGQNAPGGQAAPSR